MLEVVNIVRRSSLPQWLGSVPMRLAKAIAESGATDAQSRSTPVRVLRSTFRRAGETLVCELALSEDRETYELRTSGADAPGLGRIEKLCSVVDAFERQSAIEAALLEDGWTLERHESFLA